MLQLSGSLTGSYLHYSNSDPMPDWAAVQRKKLINVRNSVGRFLREMVVGTGAEAGGGSGGIGGHLVSGKRKRVC